MKACIVFVLLGLCFVPNSSAWWFFGKEVSPSWRKLSVTFQKWNKLPMNEKDAKSDGWTLSQDACKDSTFYKGKRYVLKGDIATMLLFDSHGQIAGMQMGYSKQLGTPQKNQIGGPIHDDGTNYVNTVYFTEPKNICKRKASLRDVSVVGEKLYFLMNGEGKIIEAPLKEENIKGTKWVEGQCFVAMGKHYWYNISNDMNCDDFFPYFLMYNGGVLNGFGFSAGGVDINSPRVEHPPKAFLGLFMEDATLPKCLPKQKFLSTQHVYLDNKPYLNLC